jgi:hypothetical protein
MTAAAEYGKYADESRAWGAKVVSPLDREQWHKIAEDWLKMAQDADDANPGRKGKP